MIVLSVSIYSNVNLMSCVRCCTYTLHDIVFTHLQILLNFFCKHFLMLLFPREGMWGCDIVVELLVAKHLYTSLCSYSYIDTFLLQLKKYYWNFCESKRTYSITKTVGLYINNSIEWTWIAWEKKYLATIKDIRYKLMFVKCLGKLFLVKLFFCL